MNVNEKDFTGGYVVLPVHEYKELLKYDLRNEVSLIVDECEWNYGEVSAYVSRKYIEDVFSEIAQSMFPGIELKKYDAKLTIGNVPKEIMDERLGKSAEEDNEE